jgi:F420-dependent oxidoreductase-like protein
MRFALFTSLAGTSWDDVLALWRHAEATGWDAACVTDHFMPNTKDRVGDSHECWTALAALAHATSRMRVGTIVSGNTYRHPAVLAKMATTVDVISGGRLICGIGGAWQQNEHEAYGIPFHTVKERLARLDEACQVLKLLWTRPRSDFQGRYYQLSDAPLMPKSVQQPHPELMIGGGGERVTLKIAARYADHWNVWGGPGILGRKGKILDEHCGALGRDPRTIVRSANMPLVFATDAAGADRARQLYMARMRADDDKARDTVLAGSPAQIVDRLGEMTEAGVSMVFVPTFLLPKDNFATLDRIMTEVAPQAR